MPLATQRDHVLGKPRPGVTPMSAVGPRKGPSGRTGWANEGATRGHKATGRGSLGSKSESTLKGLTKLPNLKR